MGPTFTHFLDSLGWAVLHSIWQGIAALIAVVLWRFLLRGRSPALRHAGQLTALIACLIAFLWTFAAYLGQSVGDVGANPSLVATAKTAAPTLAIDLIAPFDATTLAAKAGFNPSRITPILACLWALGFGFMSMRYAFAFGQVQQLRTLGISVPDAKWQARFTQLLRQSGVPQDVKLLISANVSGPLTLGFFKPIVLVPAGFLTGLSGDEVEAILLHELAHIRRYDYAFNLLQTAVKTVLFFHPAIHIISRWADQDREQACDDLAIKQGRNPLALVRGLANLRLQSAPKLSLAATGHGKDTPLMARLTRLTGTTPSRSRPEYFMISILSSLLIGTIYLSTSTAAKAHPEPKPYEHAKKKSENYRFETKRLNGRNVTVKITEDGRRWVLDGSRWIDVDENPEVLDRLPVAMPQPPEPPVFTGNNWTSFNSQDFEAKMNQFEIDMEYFEADLDRYFDDNDALSEREIEQLEAQIERQVERAERRADNFKDRFEARMERAEEQRERAQEQIERAQAQKERAKDNAKRHAMETHKGNTQHHNYDEMRDTLYGYLIQDNVIKSRNTKVLMRHNGKNWIANGKVIPTDIEHKYCDLIANMGIDKDHLTKLEIKPGSTHVVTETGSGNSKHSHKITYGQFDHGVDNIPSPAPPMPPQTHIHKTHTRSMNHTKHGTSGSFVWPTSSAKITASFDQTGKLWDKPHQGIDIKGKLGAPVYASADGTVKLVTTEPSWGNRVMLQHSGGYQSLYGHMNSFTVSRGQNVKAGDVIGTVGSTGKSSGPHLHFEIRQNDQPVDPLPLIK